MTKSPRANPPRPDAGKADPAFPSEIANSRAIDGRFRSCPIGPGSRTLKSGFHRALRYVDPQNLLLRLAILRRGRGEVRTIYFVVHNTNHVRLMLDAANHLASQGLHIRFAHLDGTKRGGVARPELDRLGIASIDFRTLKRTIRPADVLITGNDFGPPGHFRHFIDSVNRGTVRVVGIIEGARALQSHRYRRSDFVLAISPAARRHFSQPVYVVGSPAIEQSIARIRGRRKDGRFVLINFKGEPEDREERGRLEAVLAACRSLAVPSLVSVHPSKAARLDLPNASTAPFAELLPEAMALVSRPSTTIYEAIACGVPVVLYPVVEPLAEFAEPRGAFRLTRRREDLTQDIRDAIASRDRYEAIGRPFLDENLSIDPDRPAWKRMAEAMQEICSL